MGQIACQWEAVEVKLAIIYSVLLGRADSVSALREYGEGRVFPERTAALKRAAESYFVKYPDQQLEGRLDALLEACDGYIARRNDIVHSFVFPVNHMAFFRESLDLKKEDEKFLLIPPLQTGRKHAKDGPPVYAYNSNQLGNIFFQLIDLTDAISKFEADIFSRQI